MVSRENLRSEEAEPKDGLVVQSVFYTDDTDASLRALPLIEESAEAFFSLSDSYHNIFAISAPPMPGINIPHFQEWINCTGKYFEGYIQHTRTGFFKGRPYRTKDLAKIRRQTEEVLAQISSFPLSLVPLEEKEALFFFGSLLMLDRLAAKRKFILEIEPANGDQAVDFYKKGRRLINQLNLRADTDDVELPKNKADIEKLLESLAGFQNEQYRGLATLLRPQIVHFHDFLNSLINGNQHALARIFIPREVYYSFIDQKAMQELSSKGVKFRYAQTNLSGKTEDSQEANGILTRFVINPQTEVTREEVIRSLITSYLREGLQRIGLESSLKDLPVFFSKTTNQELEELLTVTILDEDEIEGAAKLLDNFGTKTTGSTYGNALIFMVALQQNPDFKGIRGLLGQAMDEYQARKGGDLE